MRKLEQSLDIVLVAVAKTTELGDCHIERTCDVDLHVGDADLRHQPNDAILVVFV